MAKNILVNGAAGRIGRAVTYELSSDDYAGGYHASLFALNDPVGIDRIVESLSGKDPVHGKYDWKVEKVDDKIIRINGLAIKVTAEKDLTKIPFKEMGIWLVEECSGFYGDDKKDKTKCLSQQFIDLGAEKVIMSYPANSADITLVMGANQDLYNAEKHKLISNGSCTTKAMVAPLQLLMDQGIGIEALLMDTAHAATNSQNILESLDNIATHKTGAAQAVGEVIPSLKGKMDGLAFRVPTSDGSFANMYFVATYAGELTAEKVNQMFKEHYKDAKYCGRLGLFEEKEATTNNDIVGRTESGVIILSKTRVLKPLVRTYGSFDNNRVYFIGLVSGYDNEAAPPKDQALLTEYIAENS